MKNEPGLYYANGKLLISGEYLVLEGAGALAVPVKMGQWMGIEKKPGRGTRYIHWQARVLDKEWFNARIVLPDMEITHTSDPGITGRVVQLLKALRKMKKDLFDPDFDYMITTHSTFDHSWGMGSSSALIANLAQWASVDPFELFYSVSKGSGYDVATALASGPIVFRTQDHKASAIPVTFRPPFHQSIWFIYRGRKQNTAESLDAFSRLSGIYRTHIKAVNRFTREFLHSPNLDAFMLTMHEHELLLSGLLGKKPLKEEHFSDFQGEIKSLGAWGGDMIMAASQEPQDYILAYFKTKGMHIVFDFQSLILT